IEIDARQSWSNIKVIRRMDFEQMSAAELAEAEAALAQLRLPMRRIRTRRSVPAVRGRADLRASLRAAMRQGGELTTLRHKAPGVRRPDLVALCDISGSMATYARVMMRFLHALAHARHPDWGKVHAFTFGTALTNVTRALKRGDPDIALSTVGREVADWEGGTRIGPALERFNKDWSRRVLARGAVVLLITDGLERADLALLDRQAERLALSADRLLWLNPLLRWEGFEPKAGGVRTLLKHATSHHPCHSLESLAGLVQALSTRPGEPR
ncbi:MAG: VWA domain-containing protein, partial [Pseudomonadota bacterium]